MYTAKFNTKKQSFLFNASDNFFRSVRICYLDIVITKLKVDYTRFFVLKNSFSFGSLGIVVIGYLPVTTYTPIHLVQVVFSVDSFIFFPDIRKTVPPIVLNSSLHLSISFATVPLRIAWRSLFSPCNTSSSDK